MINKMKIFMKGFLRILKSKIIVTNKAKTNAVE